LAEDARKEMGLGRSELIALAFFLGSDYCEGVNGIGIVNALEILQCFPVGLDSEDKLLYAPLFGLHMFKEWLEHKEFYRDVLLSAVPRLAATEDTCHYDDDDSSVVCVGGTTLESNEIVRIDGNEDATIDNKFGIYWKPVNK
jgi:5'-3' exonuclease